MYIPRHFEVTDTAWCHALMRAQSFATMITADDAGAPFATHLPMLVDDTRGPRGTLRGHVARANPHWRYLAAGRPTLVVFAGAHAYVSPSWYATHPAVPTWNYVAVHATGTGILVEDAERVRALLADLVRVYEGARPGAWSFEALAEDYVAGLQRGIVAFEIPIDGRPASASRAWRAGPPARPRWCGRGWPPRRGRRGRSRRGPRSSAGCSP